MEIKVSERLAMRSRPKGSPLMQQTWESLLFMHWPVPPASIRPLIPSGLELDLFEGEAWVSISPFRVNQLKLASLPPIPGIDSFLELNVRTYVHRRGFPGVWFFSLDASKFIPVLAARVLFALPYMRAQMSFEEGNSNYVFTSNRLISPSAEFHAHWRSGVTLADPHSESLAFFLVERYALFSGEDASISMTRIYHRPWILEEAFLLSSKSTMIAALGIPEPQSDPILHFSRSLNLDIWPLTEM
jgi:uncharacterized protein YqjF (DUF2071 family)